MIEEAHFLARGLNQGETRARPDDTQRKAGEARARAHVDDAQRTGEQGRDGNTFMRGERGDERQRVEEVARLHLCGVGDRGEIELLIPRQQLFEISFKCGDLGGAEKQPHLRRARRQSFHAGNHCAFT